MAIPVRFRVIQHKTNLNGLAKASTILNRNLRVGLNVVGKRFQKSAQSRMRKDTGETQKSLRIVVSGKGLDLAVAVFSEEIQAYIDAHGMPRGTFPPYREGTRLYQWATRKAHGIQSKRVKKFKVPKRTLFQLNKNWERRRALRGVPRIRKVPKARASGNKRVRRNKAEARRLAFLAARAIYKRGIRATHWDTKSLEANKNLILREITNALQRATSDMRKA